MMKAELYPPARFFVKAGNNKWTVLSSDDEIIQQIMVLLESASVRRNIDNSSSDDSKDENSQSDSEDVSSTHDEESLASSATYRTLGEHDVICGSAAGRTSGASNHPGNVHYYQLLEGANYSNSSDSIIDGIITTFENLQPRGRFLSKQGRKWQELSEVQIRKKIRKALYRNKKVILRHNDVAFDEDKTLLSADEGEDRNGNDWLTAKIEEYSGKSLYTAKENKSIAREIMNATETEVYPPIRFMKASKSSGQSWAVMSKEEVEKHIISLLKSTSSTIKEKDASSYTSDDGSSVANSTTLSTPEEHDVICGQDNPNFTNNHPGNHHYDQLVEQYREEYHQEDCDDSIVNIIIDTFANLEPAGRFLDQHRTNGTWKELSTERIKTKIHKSLRKIHS